jgi:hypothetical protein
MILRLLLTVVLIAGTAVVISLIPYDFEVSFRKDWQDYRVGVRFRLLRGRLGLDWGPYLYEWRLDQGEDDKGLWHTLMDSLKTLKQPPFSFGQKLELLDVLGTVFEKSRIREFRWHTEIGLKGPAETAVLSGALWAFKGWFCTRVLSAMGRVPAGGTGKRPVSWGVQPNFIKPGLRIDVVCHLSGRVWGIASPLVAFLYRVAAERLKKLVSDYLTREKNRKEKLAIPSQQAQ